ncbi:MAG: hypothetical protein IT458_02750 [Planctomycetes bacterium]|nr:hypothetical protein [Planctomycetota bacterium]
MSALQRRIALLGVGFALLLGVLAVALFHQMILRGSVYQERSWANRWGYHGHGAERGPILDREGNLLVRDDPSWSLHIEGETFFGQHPVGVLVLLERRVRAARGEEPRARFVAPATRPDGLFEWLLAQPLADTPPGDIDREQNRAVRAQIVDLLVRLGAGTRRDVAARLIAARRDTPSASLRSVLRASQLDAVRAALQASAEELARVGADLRLACGVDLATHLQAALECWGGTRPGLNRRIARRIPYELALALQLRKERLAGLLVVQEIERRISASLPGRPDLGCLTRFLGRVGQRPAAAADAGAAQVEDRLDEVERELQLALGEDGREGEDPYAASAAGEPDGVASASGAEDDEGDSDLERAALRRARRAMAAYFSSRGRVGLSGVEAAADAALRERPGLRWVERTRARAETGLVGYAAAEPGRPVRLTVDLRLQALVEDLLDADPEAGGGAVQRAMVVAEPATGEILALASRPVRAEWSDALVAPHRANPAPGSVVKPFVLLQHLDAARTGAPHVGPEALGPCRGIYHVPGFGTPIRCTHPHGEEARDPRLALAHSCNRYFAQLAGGLGPDGLRAAFQRAGLWLPAPGEPAAPGTLDDPASWRIPGIQGLPRPRVRLGGLTVEQNGIGYDMVTSPLHVARAYCALATGALPRLRLIQDAAAPAPVPLGVPAEDLELVRDGMELVVTVGSARKVRGLKRLGVLGKTGTAEVRRAGEPGVFNNAWFAGYTTRAAPTLVVVAVAYGVPDGQHGAEVGGAMVEDFLRRVHGAPELRARYLPGVP